MNRRGFLKLLGFGIPSLLIAPKVFAKTEVSHQIWNPPVGFNRGSLDAVNHRRIVLEIKRIMEEILVYHRYDLNDNKTHLSIQTMMNARLECLRNERIISDYVAICNDANNPPVRIDQGYINLDVSVNLNKDLFQSINMVASLVKENVSFIEFTN